jgi:primosomal replication protein N
MRDLNEVHLSGLINKIYPPIHTPSGVVVSRMQLAHRSEQFEGGVRRRVTCNLYCISVAAVIDPALLGTQVCVSGFLSQNSQKQLVLHLSKIHKD